MGGNVVLGDNAAERIDLKKISRSEIVPILYDSLKKINAAFNKQTGFPMWSEEVLKNRSFLSGSAFHFFDLEKIKDISFTAVKPSVGDIDTQINIMHAPFVKKWLEDNQSETFGDLTLIGYKTSADQYITLWSSEKYQFNVQIDLEQVPFDEDGNPTTWAQFSHSSSWEDIVQGVKGVAHKYLLRAMNAKDLKEVLIRTKTGKEKVMTTSELAFSTSGLRTKLDAITVNGKQEYKDGLPVFREMPTSETGFETDLDVIFIAYFGHAPSKDEKQLMWSFTGLLELIRNHFDQSTKIKIADGFMNTLWGKGAQTLYRDDPEKDLNEKTEMANVMVRELNLNIKRWSNLIAEFYQ